MTTVYLLIIEDRHADVAVRVFAAKKDALAAARDVFSEYKSVEGRDAHIDRDRPAEWLFAATLTCEGDCLRVEAAEVE